MLIYRHGIHRSPRKNEVPELETVSVLPHSVAILSEIMGTPKIRSPPDFFGIATALTGGGK